MWIKIKEFLKWFAGVLGKTSEATSPDYSKAPNPDPGLLYMVRDPMTFDVQSFLESKRSGLAKTTPFKVAGNSYTPAQWIEKVAESFGIKPQYILMVLQAEQGLVTYGTPLDAEYEIRLLNYVGESKPPVPAGWSAVRNGGKYGTKYVADGNMWFMVKGPWKMLAATGAGIPDPSVFPPWDVRKYIGFSNQVFHTARLTSKYYREFAESEKDGDPTKRSVKLYSGEVVVADDPQTLALLKYTPNEKVLTQRPSIYRKLFG